MVPRLTAALLGLGAALAGVGCAGTERSLREALDEADLQARLAARGRRWMGHGPGPYEAGGQRFNADCTGFVEAVYQAEGVPLRRLMQQAAPREDSGVAAAWEATGRYGRHWRGGDWPAPGDLVFFDDTWDRNHNGSHDDPFTHVGMVEWVDEAGTVSFLHRAGAGVVRGHLTLSRPAQWKAANGTELNAPLRVRVSRDDRAPALAGELFVGFGRIEPGRAGLATRG